MRKCGKNRFLFGLILGLAVWMQAPVIAAEETLTADDCKCTSDCKCTNGSPSKICKCTNCISQKLKCTDCIPLETLSEKEDGGRNLGNTPIEIRVWDFLRTERNDLEQFLQSEQINMDQFVEIKTRLLKAQELTQELKAQELRLNVPKLTRELKVVPELTQELRVIEAPAQF